MSVFSQRMTELRHLLKLHSNWLVYITLGESALTKSEVSELKKYGKLPMQEPLGLVENSYFLGRMCATKKTSEYKTVVKAVTATLKAAEELALEAVKQKAIKRLKSIVTDLLESKNKQAWRSVVLTEFQSAKIQGIANTIANKSDIYENSGGADSNVSVIPAKECCEDCRFHYVDVDGNPKIFKLADLMNAGSNSDVGTVHTKVDGRHTHWKTTLPPMHIKCGCKLTYIPPGHGWDSGKLSLLNKSLFIEHVSKAQPGVRGPGLSATVAPTGAPSVAKEPGHPSVPGAAAPGNLPGPGRPAGGGSGGGGGGGGGKDTVDCPWADCDSGGRHHTDSQVYKDHSEMAAKTGKFTEKAKQDKEQSSEQQSKAFNSRNPHQQVVYDHLSKGKIASMRKLGDEDEAGQNASFKISIEGNGSGLMKPHIDYASLMPRAYGRYAVEDMSPEEFRKNLDNMMGPGAGTMPDGMNPSSEAGMSGLANGLGLGNVFPITVLRNHDGDQGGPKGLTSVQHWNDNAISTTKYAGSAALKNILETTLPEHRDDLLRQFSTIAVMDIVANNGDRHMANVMIDPGKSTEQDLPQSLKLLPKDARSKLLESLKSKKSPKVVPIDHGAAFGNGLSGHRNVVANEIHKNNFALTIEPELQEKLKNQSIDSTFRSLEESGLPEWCKAQTYLRQKYVLHMQEKFDHIPYDRIRSTQTTCSGAEMFIQLPDGKCDGWDDADGVYGFFQAQVSNQLPYQQFNGFAKAWMEKRINDPSHPEHQDAKRLFAMQPIRSNKQITGREEATEESINNYYADIPKYDLDEPDAARIKAAMPKKKPEKESISVRTSPEVPTQEPPKKTPRPAGIRQARPELAEPEIELEESDLEELEPGKVYSEAALARTQPAKPAPTIQDPSEAARAKTQLSLDMSDFNEDADIDEAFERIRTKSFPVSKSLYLKNPNAIFVVDDSRAR